jgi:tRNA dimethylallyltransferase
MSASLLKNKTCIVIAGPTAVGKTNFAIRLAQHFNTQIISTDSRQCYKELNIGVAKPSVKELQQVPHHFINSHSINNDVNAALFEKYALQKIDEIFLGNTIAVVVGGTGLYIKAFCEGIDEIPTIDEAIRKKIIADYTSKGLVWLQQQVQINDAVYYAQGEIQNPQRLMRALEVKLSTGNSIITYQTQQKQTRSFNIVKLALELPREELYNRINNRVDAMMDAGLLQEAKELLPQRNLNALQTVGYRELFAYFNGDISLNQAVELIKQNSRHYAKRQLTWFKKDMSYKWLSPSTQMHHVLANILQEK